MLTKNASYCRRAGLDARVLARSLAVIARALEGGRHLTRRELAGALAKARLNTEEQRLAYLMMNAELESRLVRWPLSHPR